MDTSPKFFGICIFKNQVLNGRVCFNVVETISLGTTIKETKSVTMSIFEKNSFLFKSFVKIELSYVFTINMFSTAENCIEK